MKNGSPFRSVLSVRLSESIARSGLLQRILAERVGCTEVSMSRYISGRRVPKGPIIEKIAEALHVTTDYLLGNEASDDPETVYNSIF